MTSLKKYRPALFFILITLSGCSAYYEELTVDEEGFIHECGNEPGLEPCDVDNEAMLLQTDEQLEKEAGEEREKINEEQQAIN